MNNTCYLSDIFLGDYEITQFFGNNPAYYKQFGLAGHEGIDFGTPVGIPIIAPYDGVVLRQGVQEGYRNYGTCVVVWDPTQRCAVWYGHLSEEYVSTGELVKRGQVLGKTGNSGNTTGPHLHMGFVRTDAYGNRLYTNNGYIGFLNPLDPGLVTWKLNTPNQPEPSADEFVKRAEDAARALFNAVEAGSHINDKKYKKKLIDAGVKVAIDKTSSFFV